MISGKILSVLLLFVSVTGCSQQTRVDTIPFTLSKKLLVFKGTMNDVSVDFAFDTGAGMGVANSATQKRVPFNVKNSKKGITDANMKTVKLQNIGIEKLSIGGYEFKNIKSILHDMEYLKCNDLYLLGMDVIGKLNWRINFSNNTIQVSETPFAVDSSYTALPIKYLRNRPVTDLYIGNYKMPKCLIDFGFTGTIDIPESGYINQLFSEKQQAGFSSVELSSTMALTGLGKADTVKLMKLDSVLLGGRLFKKIPVIISEKTDFKIGVGFFANYCTQLVLNHTDDSYYFVYNNNPTAGPNKLDTRITYTNGKLFVTGKNLSANSTALGLSIGEEVKSVDGKTAANFANNCEFLNSFYLSAASEILIEKLNGEKLAIKRQEIK